MPTLPVTSQLQDLLQSREVHRVSGHLRQADDQGSGTLCVGVTTYRTRRIQQLSFLI